MEVGINGLLAETGWHHIGIDALEEAKRLVDLPHPGAVLSSEMFAPAGIGKSVTLPREANPEPVLPAGLPPLPPGTRYGGQLKDYDGFVSGWCCYSHIPDDWEFYDEWLGAKGEPSHTVTADMHVALLITPKP